MPSGFIDERILLPMRWAAAATAAAARRALRGAHCWNLAGGYRHASRNAAEGFCIYNDVGIAVDQLRAGGGAYVPESATAMTRSLLAHAER